MKTSDSDLKVNRNIYPDAVNVIGNLNMNLYVKRMVNVNLYVKRMLPLFRAVGNKYLYLPRK